ncbi:MAG: beta-propeller fold lactonase family protein [Blastocatellia bacterium]|nr:beta-propeller fold lactonase family protein [Blastocatellia bacterium]
MIKLLIVAIAFSGLALSAISTAGQSETDEFLYVHNTYSGEISKISIPGHEVVGSIKIGLYMDYVAASPAGDILYVNRVDSMGVDIPVLGESGELVAISAATDEILWRMKLDAMPHHMSVSRDGRFVFVPYYNSWWLAVVDVEKREVIKKIYVGNGPHGTRLSADGKRLYVGSMMNDVLSIIDTEKLEVIGRIPFGDGVRPFDFTDDEKMLYVQLSRLHGFEVVDLQARKKIRTVPLPPLPENVKIPEFYPHNVNHGLLLSPDEKLLFANGSIMDYVAVYLHPELELIKTIPVGREPNSIAFSKDGRYCYVSNRKSDDLSIISVSELKEIKRLKVGRYPQRMVVIKVPKRKK